MSIRIYDETEERDVAVVKIADMGSILIIQDEAIVSLHPTAARSMAWAIIGMTDKEKEEE